MTARWNIAPYFIVDDVRASAEYYRDSLGFQFDRFWGEGPDFVMVHRRGITVMMSRIDGVRPQPNGRAAGGDGDDAPWDAYVWVDDADALYEEFQRAGVRIARPICDQPYGCRDFDIEDINGYRLCFGHDLGE